MTSLQKKQYFDELSEWYQTPIGKNLYDSLFPIAERTLHSLCGYHAISMGCARFQDIFKTSSVRQKIWIEEEKILSDSHFPTVLCDFHTLPFQKRSIDLVCLWHVLEDPRWDMNQLFSEIMRILIPDGKIVIVGFNRFSMWRILQAFYNKDTRVIQSPRRIALGPMLQTLVNHHCEINLASGVFFPPPFGIDDKSPFARFLEMMGRIHFPVGGALYVVSAQKKTSVLTHCFDKRHKRVSVRGFLPHLSSWSQTREKNS